MEKQMGWALVGTGSIVRKFLAGLRVAKGVSSVCVVSRSQEKADLFAQEYGLRCGYGQLIQALEDPLVDIVYIGTPHSTHREIALQAIRAKKAVLCEKPVTIAAWEMEEIAEAAKENHTFFMEAMWPRFMPAISRARGWINEGQIGEVKLVQANFGFVVPWLPQSRLLNPMLGGGALLDAGVYPLSIAAMVFAGQKVQSVKSILTMGTTQVDEQVMGVVSFGEGRLASINAAIRTNMQSDAWIYGTLGRIHMKDFVFGREATLRVDGKFETTYAPDTKGNGYNYEAEEVMRCLQNGHVESAIMPISESIEIMKIMDAIRFEAKFKYPFES